MKLDQIHVLEKLLTLHEKLPHRVHQLEGVEQLVLDEDPRRGRVIPFAFALFDEVGAGKTKQVIDAAQVLYLGNEIDTMLVITPGFARSTWAEEDPDLGEVAKHAWDIVPNVIHEYHRHCTDIDFSSKALHWVVSNYEFIRRDNRLHDLLAILRGRKTYLVLDESWAVKGFSDQMKACRTLRAKRALRAVELNGTPLADGKPEDLYYPFMILDPDIIGAQNRTHFRAEYCIIQADPQRRYEKVIGYRNLGQLNSRIAPYVLTRRTRDCFDLPPMLDPIIVEARLTPPTWKMYVEQRDEMVSWLGSQASVSKQAIVKALRLAQITSGFLGGLEELQPDAPIAPPTDPIPQWLRAKHPDAAEPDQTPVPAFILAPGGTGPQTREIGREKLDSFLHWLETWPDQPDKLLVWTRFTPELERTTRELLRIYPQVRNLRGKQSETDRTAAKLLLAPGNKERGAVVGNQKAGGASLNFSAANVAVYLSNGPALIERTQSIGRIERPGATQPMLIVDVVATGPRGQKTIDHAILKALRNKEDMARWTVAQWRAILKGV